MDQWMLRPWRRALDCRGRATRRDYWLFALQLTLLFGALVLKVKEANALINLMQWAVSFLMGIFFPVAVMPPLLRAVALARAIGAPP